MEPDIQIRDRVLRELNWIHAWTYAHIDVMTSTLHYTRRINAQVIFGERQVKAVLNAHHFPESDGRQVSSSWRIQQGVGPRASSTGCVSENNLRLRQKRGDHITLPRHAVGVAQVGRLNPGHLTMFPVECHLTFSRAFE
jgi:hypothetical protein